MSRIRLSRPGRRAAFAIGTLLALLLALAAGWYYSSLLKSGALLPDYSPDDFDYRIVSIESGRVTLTPDGGDEDNLRDGNIWGVEGENAYGQVHAILGAEGDDVTREFELLQGSFRPGERVRLDSFAFTGDPMAGRGMVFREVIVPSPLGDLPAWRVEGDRERWAIFVHGWRSEREEALRMMPVVSSAGFSLLAITYRNDEEAPRSPDGLIRWGATEWQDLEAAIDYAEAQGARSVVLYGFSMGGGIVVSFLERSDKADIVTGAILDAPVLDFAAVVDFEANRRHIPGFLVTVGKQFTTWRFDFDWHETDHMAQIDKLDVPILLFHGDEDDRAPIATSDRFAQERSDIVTYVVTKGAGHVRSWNVDPHAYESTVSDFLGRLRSRP